ncbi:MAG: hypothetical protein JKY69_07060 [Flavobacteriaceae bacterium]|nr:hypothetical protein [Flavobacteriaceae bacterium]
MRIILRLLFIILFFFGNQTYSQSSDNDDPVIKAIELIKKEINSTDSLRIHIKLVNGHCWGIVEINSSIILNRGKVLLESRFRSNSNEDVNSIFSFSKREFLNELENHIKIINDEDEILVLSGMHQEIILTIRKQQKVFKSRKAIMFLQLFSNGKLNY